MTAEKPLLYLAAPLFSAAERGFNEVVADRLEPFFQVFLPQRDGRLLVDLIDSGVPAATAASSVFSADIAAIRQASVVLALLDGRTVDEGVAFELGFAFCLGTNCIGLQTDPRRELPTGNNPMIEGGLDQIFRDIDQLVIWARGA
jgi:nucleoside 2-deoxyribosyltransferase